MELGLCELIETKLELEAPKRSESTCGRRFSEPDDAFTKVLRDTCFYLVGNIGAFDYQKNLKQYVKFSELPLSAKEFRLAVLELGKYTLNLKLYLLNVVKTNGFPKEFSSRKDFLRKTCLAAGVKLRDGARCYKAIHPHIHKLRKCKRIKATPKKIVNPYHREHWHLKFNGVVYKPVMKTIKQITYTKLRFISSSTNAELADLHSELAIKALQTYYRLVPTTADDAYIINYIRRAVSNHAKNIIKTYTSQKRGRMVRSGKDGFGGSNFDLIIVSENQIRAKAGEDGANITYDQLGDAFNAYDGMRSIESMLSIKALKRRYRGVPRKYEVLKILLGEEHAGFTAFLKAKGVMRVGTNSDFQDRCDTERYLQLIAEFTRISVRSLTKFKNAVGKHYSVEGKVRHVSNG